MSKAFAVVHVAFVGVLIFGAVGIWRIKCEGFGCTGVGIASRKMSSDPCFKRTAVAELTHVSKHGFWWPLDADLSVESIRDPAAFPRVTKAAG
jgi:hypothetical protein